MQHLLPFYLFFCLIAGVAAGLVLILVRRVSGNRSLTWAIVFIVCMSLCILSKLLMQYRSINISKGIAFIDFLILLVLAPFSVVQFMAGPLFIHRLLDVPFRKIGDAVVIFVSIASCVLSVSPLSVGYSPDSSRIMLNPGNNVLQYISLVLILYTVAVAIAYRKRLKDARQAKMMRQLIILTLVFIPGFTRDLLFFSNATSIERFPIIIIFYPLYFCILSIFSAYRGIAWLLRRKLATGAAQAAYQPYLSEPERLAALGLSEREAELVPLVLAGLGNKQIADRLHISAKTVSNHLYNIYQKLGINSRYELLALLGRA
jgi:DNA-binding CsgD family transcriptional regulator